MDEQWPDNHQAHKHIQGGTSTFLNQIYFLKVQQGHLFISVVFGLFSCSLVNCMQIESAKFCLLCHKAVQQNQRYICYYVCDI